MRRIAGGTALATAYLGLGELEQAGEAGRTALAVGARPLTALPGDLRRLADEFRVQRYLEQLDA
ncbi:MAG: hypothetical protein ACRDTC_25340 [Pseudonocardiaceae bacterium]